LLPIGNKLAQSNNAPIKRVAQGGGVLRPQAHCRKALFTSFQAVPLRAKTANLTAVSSSE